METTSPPPSPPPTSPQSSHPRAKELRTRILARRREREEFSGLTPSEPPFPSSTTNLLKNATASKFLPTLPTSDNDNDKDSGGVVTHKHLSTQKTTHFQTTQRLTNYTQTNRNFLNRINQQFTLHGLLATLKKDISDVKGRNMEKIDTVRKYEKRLVKLQSSVNSNLDNNETGRGSNNNNNADKEVDNGLRGAFSKEIQGEFGSCARCGERFVRHLLDLHVLYCHGHTGVNTNTNTAFPLVAGFNEGEEKINSNDKGNSKTEVVYCEHCGKRFTPSSLKKHVKTCLQATQQEQAQGQEQASSTSSTTSLLSLLPPQKPRNLTVLNITHDAFELTWDPPILDGGSRVYDYEITYQVCHIEKIGKRSLRHISAMPAISCSRWLHKHPIAAYGFVVEELEAGVEYVDICVRCRNSVDWGPPSLAVPSVTTLEARPPSVPLFVTLIKCTSEVIAFTWDEPMNEGGKPVVDYIVNYTEVRPASKVGVSSSIGKFEHIKNEVYIGGSHTYHKVFGLSGDTLYKAFTIRAVNSHNLLSPPAVYGDVTTLPPTLRQRILNEIKRTHEGGDGDTIDSDYYSGFVKRENREDHLKKLRVDLDAVVDVEGVHDVDLNGHDDGNAGRREARWKDADKFNFNPNNGGNDNNEGHTLIAATDEQAKELSMPGYTRKKAQYLYRIKTLEGRVVHLEELSLAAVANRGYLTYQMTHMQSRMLSIQGELDRVSTFRGTVINSDVIHGSDQRFTVAQLTLDLQGELDKGQEAVSSWKAEVIQGDHMKTVHARDGDRNGSMLAERRAAYKAFMSQSNRVTSFGSRNTKSQRQSPKEAMDEYFALWRGQAVVRGRVRRLMLKVWGSHGARYVRLAWIKWVHGSHAHTTLTLSRSRRERTCIGDSYDIVSQGGVMLLKSEVDRIANCKAVSEVMGSLKETGNEAKLSEYTNKQKLELVSNEYYKEVGVGTSGNGKERDLAFMIQGDAFFNVRDYVKAEECFDDQIRQVNDDYNSNNNSTASATTVINNNNSEEPKPDLDVQLLSVLYGRKGSCHRSLQNWDRSILNYDRQRSLASEITSHTELAAACMGLADGYVGKGEYNTARVLYERAGVGFDTIGDRRKVGLAYRGIQGCYERLYNSSHAERYRDKADGIFWENEAKIKEAKGKLEGWKERLIDTTAASGKVVPFERITAGCIRMRDERGRLKDRIGKTSGKLEEQRKEVRMVEGMLEAIDRQLEEARNTDKDEMVSALVHEREQVFEIEELKVRLAEKRGKIVVENESVMARERKIDQTVKNLKDDLNEIDIELAVEQGPLMQHVLKQRILRCISLNPSNTASNEVTGTASGGVPLIAACEANNVNVYDIHTGVLKRVFSGDEKGRHAGEVTGHTGVITCLIFHDTRIYSGAMDRAVMCWDVESSARIYTALGHDATVTCINVDAFKMITGGADANVIIWDKHTGGMLRAIQGHLRGVNCIHSGSTWFASGGSEGEIRVWSHSSLSDDVKFRNVKCIGKLKGHGCSVTVVKYGKLEVISGDANGTVIVWWLQTGKILQTIHAHTGSIYDLQFDATKIVTCGVDYNLQVIDITTGDILQTLRGHTGAVVGLAFDTSKIASVSSDGTMRHWEWGVGKQKLANKMHVYDAGDNLAKIARKYKVSIPEVILWNGIKDVKKLYIGQKLVVAKGDPTVKTDAEIMASKNKSKEIAREAKVGAKIKLAMEFAEKEIKGDGGEASLFDKSIHIDHKSLASRVMKGTGQLPPEEYLDEEQVKSDRDKIEKEDYRSLRSRFTNGGKTRDQMRVVIDQKVMAENNVNDDIVSSTHANFGRIRDDVAMFILYTVVDEMVGNEIVRECTTSDVKEETLGGRMWSYSYAEREGKGKEKVKGYNRRVTSAGFLHKKNKASGEKAGDEKEDASLSKGLSERFGESEGTAMAAAMVTTMVATTIEENTVYDSADADAI